MNIAAQGGDNADHLGAHESGVDAFVATARLDEAARNRRTDRWSRQRAQESATIVGALLGSIGRNVEVHLSTGDVLAATVNGVGIDVAELRLPDRSEWIALAHVSAVGTTGRVGPGDPADRADAALVDLLGDLAVLEGSVSVTLAGGARIDGRVTAAGESLVLTDHARSTVVIDPSAIVRVHPHTPG